MAKSTSIPAPVGPEVETAQATTPEVPQSEPKPAVKREVESFCVYLGPSIRGAIQTGTVYPGTMRQSKKRLAAVIDKYPRVAKLVVTNLTLVQDRVLVKTKGNALNVIYTQLVSELNKEEK